MWCGVQGQQKEQRLDLLREGRPGHREAQPLRHVAKHRKRRGAGSPCPPAAPSLSGFSNCRRQPGEDAGAQRSGVPEAARRAPVWPAGLLGHLDASHVPISGSLWEGGPCLNGSFCLTVAFSPGPSA